MKHADESGSLVAPKEFRQRGVTFVLNFISAALFTSLA